MIYIATLSNKPSLLPDAVASVESQTRRDWWHAVKVDDGEPADRYRPGLWWNAVAEMAGPDDYLCWLSDDDLLLPNYCEVLAGALDAHPEWGAVYGGSVQVMMQADGGTVPVRAFPADRIYSTAHPPCCQIDGGQVMVRRSVMDQIERPWHPVDLEQCHVSDGLLMNRMVTVAPFMPVGVQVMVNRTTAQSSHWYVEGDQLRHRRAG